MLPPNFPFPMPALQPRASIPRPHELQPHLGCREAVTCLPCCCCWRQCCHRRSPHSLPLPLCSEHVLPYLHKLQSIPDGDMYLDALPLLYEAIVLGPASKWAPYLATLPSSYALPVNYR